MNGGTAQLTLMTELLERDTTESVIGAFYEVYNTLGYGFLEHIYTMALERELRGRGCHVDREVGVRIMYKGELLSNQRMDMIVEGRVVIEVKSTYDLPSAARRQIRNYLRATNLEVGLLLHFGPSARFFREVRSNPKRNPRESAESADLSSVGAG